VAPQTHGAATTIRTGLASGWPVAASRAARSSAARTKIGLHAAEGKVHVHDLHATILSLLGLDYRKLTYFFQGRDFRLTDVGGGNDLAARLIKA